MAEFITVLRCHKVASTLKMLVQKRPLPRSIIVTPVRQKRKTETETCSPCARNDTKKITTETSVLTDFLWKDKQQKEFELHLSLPRDVDEVDYPSFGRHETFRGKNEIRKFSSSECHKPIGKMKDDSRTNTANAGNRQHFLITAQQECDNDDAIDTKDNTCQEVANLVGKSSTISLLWAYNSPRSHFDGACPPLKASARKNKTLSSDKLKYLQALTKTMLFDNLDE